ncbi:MAG: hypothetical protein IK086_02260, partial [Clostridia bacterium]|nr:hypothetical protein [Clostridia bacterium]
MDRKVAVLINSCDDYVDILDYFFYFLNNAWDCPYKIYLNMETINYQNISLKKTFTFGKKPWSQRLIKCLKEINEDYVITFLDDFFLMDTVDQKRLDDCIDKMCKDDSIGYYMFQLHCSNPFNITGKDDSFRIRDKREKYLSSAQICLWRKNYLLQ